MNEASTLLKEIRCTYVNVLEQNKYGNYSITLLFNENDPKDKKIMDSLEQIFTDLVSKAKVINKPLKQIDPEKSIEDYTHTLRLSNKPNKQPIVFNREGNTVTSIEDCSIYNGCYVSCKVIFNDYDTPVKGITAKMSAVGFSADGVEISRFQSQKNEAEKELRALYEANSSKQ